MEPIQPGYKSTEFYVTLAVLGLAAAFALPADAVWQLRLGAFFGAVASAITYKLVRTAQKNNHAETQEAIASGKDAGFATVRLLASIAVLAIAILSSCALRTAEGRAQLGHDLLACGIAVGLAEFRAVTDQAVKVLEDGRIDESEVASSLGAIKTAAGPALIDCAVALIHDAIKLPPELPKPEGVSAVAALHYDNPKARAKRRAGIYLASKAPAP